MTPHKGLIASNRRRRYCRPESTLTLTLTECTRQLGVYTPKPLCYHQCLKLSQKSCRSSCLESQIINMKLKKNQHKVPGPHPKLSASDWRTCGYFQHWLPLPLECTHQPHSEYHRCTLGCHSMDFVKSLTNRNTLQMECTLHCHSYNLVFAHAYTLIPLRGL